MKRNFALVLLMVLLEIFLAPTALSEGTDLTFMSLDDLLTLRKNVESEISARLRSDASLIYAGKYYVGKDIKEGSYIMTCTRQDYPNKSLQILVYPNEEIYIDVMSKKVDFATSHSSFSALTEGNSAYVALENGMLMFIASGDCHVQTAESNWEP